MDNDFNGETKKELSSIVLIKALGISYDEFDKLDFDEQQKIIGEYHKKNSKFKGKDVLVMLDSGEHSIFTRVKKGERVMIGTGEDSCFIEAGLTPEESRKRLDDRFDDAIYSKSVAAIKKLVRKIKG